MAESRASLSGRAADSRNARSGFWLRCTPSVQSPRALVEVLAGMVIVIAVCFWFKPHDPLLFEVGFPWLGVFALVFALRYGALLGAVAGGCLLLAWWLFYGQIGAIFPTGYFVGVFVLLLLCGHFSDRWSERLNYETSTNRYLSGRLISIINGYYLLRISHDRVERELLSKPTTLRGSIEHLRALAGENRAGSPLPGIQEFLDYLASVSQVNEAAVFAEQEGVLSRTSCAHVGTDFSLNERDPLLRRCLETNELTHVRGYGEGVSEYLVCLPIRSALGSRLGVLAVRRMAFMALNSDSLQFLLVMFAAYADGTVERPMIDQIRKDVADCPEGFALELARVAHLSATGGPASQLVAIALRKSAVEQAVYAQLVRQRRSLDTVWTIETADSNIMITLLVLTEESGVDGYVRRMEHLAKAQFGLDSVADQFGVYHQPVDARHPGEGLRQFVATWRPA